MKISYASLLSKDYNAFSGLAEPRMPRGPSLIFESDGILFALIAECVASNFQVCESVHAFSPKFSCLWVVTWIECIRSRLSPRE